MCKRKFALIEHKLLLLNKFMLHKRGSDVPPTNSVGFSNRRADFDSRSAHVLFKVVRQTM